MNIKFMGQYFPTLLIQRSESWTNEFECTLRFGKSFVFVEEAVSSIRSDKLRRAISFRVKITFLF